MKPNHKQLNAPNNPLTASASQATTATNSNHIKIEFAPSADEVASKVYLNHGNQRSLPGDELQRWLQAEAQLLAERNATEFTAFLIGHSYKCPGQSARKESIDESNQR